MFELLEKFPVQKLGSSCPCWLCMCWRGLVEPRLLESPSVQVCGQGGPERDPRGRSGGWSGAVALLWLVTHIVTTQLLAHLLGLSHQLGQLRSSFPGFSFSFFDPWARYVFSSTMKGPASIGQPTLYGQRQRELRRVAVHPCRFQLVLTPTHFASAFLPQTQLLSSRYQLQHQKWG